MLPGRPSIPRDEPVTRMTLSSAMGDYPFMMESVIGRYTVRARCGSCGLL